MTSYYLLLFSQQNVHPAVVKQQYDTHNVWRFEHQWSQELCTCKPAGRCKFKNLYYLTYLLEYLGCFACFCPWCMGCKLASRLGEPSILGCCPGSTQYFRTKLRTARRIEVCRNV